MGLSFSSSTLKPKLIGPSSWPRMALHKKIRVRMCCPWLEC